MSQLEDYIEAYEALLVREVGKDASIRVLEAELARQRDYDAVANALRATTTAKEIKDKMVERARAARAYLLDALGLHPPGQCPGVGCGCERLCVDELAGMVAKELAECVKKLPVQTTDQCQTCGHTIASPCSSPNIRLWAKSLAESTYDTHTIDYLHGIEHRIKKMQTELAEYKKASAAIEGSKP